MTIDTERSTNKERKWRAWVGSQEDLSRLAVMMENLTKQRREILIEKIRAESAEEIESQEEQIDSIRNYLESITRGKIAAIEEYYSVTVTSKDGDDTTKGDFQSVLNEVDRRTVKSIKFESGRYSDKLEVEFKRLGYDKGVKLTVSSPDQGWAKRSFVELSDEIAKGVPRYAWILGGLGRVVISVGSSLFIVAAITLMILPAVSHKDRANALTLGAFSALWLSFLIMVPDRLYDWLAPRLELIGQDSQSTGSRRIGFLVGLVIAVIIGIIVNRIYS